MIIDRRFLIEESVDEVRGEIEAVLEKVKSERPKFTYDLREMWSVTPTMTEKDAPVVTSIHKAISDVLGKEAQYVVSPGTYDQKHIDRIGKLKNCIAYGPGLLELAHKPDEYIGVEDMIDSAKVMAHSLLDLLVPKEG
jgi:succinyl-diaminopimelate desuccinylase